MTLQKNRMLSHVPIMRPEVKDARDICITPCARGVDLVIEDKESHASISCNLSESEARGVAAALEAAARQVWLANL